MATSRSGFWVTVIDRESAVYAVRMAGLPVLLIAASPLLAALMNAVTPATVGDPLQRSTVIILALLLSVCGLRGWLWLRRHPS